MRTHQYSALLAVVALSCAASAQQSVSSTLGSLQFRACEIGSGPSKSEAECAYFEVPENPDKPDGTKIKLHIAKVAAAARKAAADPLIYIAGGPGQSGSDSYGQVAGGFSKLLEERHLLIVDQRGTGLSNALKCNDEQSEAEYEALMGKGLPEAELETEILSMQRGFAKRCLSSLKADVKYYTTGVAIQDLEALRKAVNAPQLNLVGISYGTRVAQQYALRYPQSTRSLILDGVAPNDHYLGTEHARNIDASIEAILKRCFETKDCKQRFGDPRETLAKLREQLKASTTKIDIPEPLSGKLTAADWNLGPLQLVGRFAAYNSSQSAMLPLMLDEAAKGRPQAMLGLSEIMGRGLDESISRGMELSVMCSEDASFFTLDPTEKNTLMGDAMRKSLIALCEEWPKGSRAANFFEPLKGAIPTLIISGSEDPVTPAKFGEQVVKNLSNAKHLVVPFQGHSNLSLGCVPKLAANFVSKLKPAELETECVDKMTAAPFFLDLTGPSP
jgi:pimeloyl-ACP methyl ester carboxylesterase